MKKRLKDRFVKFFLILFLTGSALLIPSINAAEEPGLAPQNTAPESGGEGIAESPTPDEREAYRRQVEEKIRDFNRQLTELQSKAEWNAAEDVKAEWNELTPALEEKVRVAQNLLEELKTTAAEAWDEAKFKLDETLEDLRRSFQEAAPQT